MRKNPYESFDPGGGATLVRTESKELLKQIDAVVFDCDGTLIDARKSYDATIMRTVTTLLEKFSEIRLPLERVGGEMILKIRRTGGFNSDWDSTYALSLLSEVAVEQSRSAGMDSADQMIEKLGQLVTEFASRNRLAGRKSIDRYLIRKRLATADLERFQRFLGYPGNPIESILTATFDQLYYGGELYEEIYGVRPAAWYDEGLIKREKLFIGREDLLKLSKIIGGRRMAIATGRPLIAVKYTLGRLLPFFVRDASVFIGDGDIHPELSAKLAKYRKPSGASLILAKNRLPARVILYIGDSAEDRLMVKDARRHYREILFAGIYGSSFNEKSQISYFSRTNSDLIVKSVDQVPEVLEMIRR